MREIRPEIYWTHLYWLTVLEEQKSYTRAAEKLAVSKSAISQKISELERVTGKTLVHRTTRSVTLSEDGLRLVAELNEPFGQIREIFTGTCDEEGGPLRGTLRLTAPVAFSRQQLVPAITPFLHQHPQLHLQLEVTDRLVSLASEGFDLAIRHCRRELLPETHVAWPLCRTATVALLPDFSAREAIGRGLVQELLPGWRPVDAFAESLYVIRPYTPRVSRAVETFSRYLKATFS